MALSLLVTVAAVAALTLARQGFFSTDVGAELRDNSRLAVTLLRRLVVQAGFIDNEYAIGKGVLSAFNMGDDGGEPNIKGFNNAQYNQNLVIGMTNAVASSGSGINGSDLLVVRFQGNRSYLNDPSATSSSSLVDGGVVDCKGIAVTAPTKPSDMTLNAFYVATSKTTGEPTLYCARQVIDASGTTWDYVPLIDGVENFQVLYGVDQVTPGVAPVSSSSVDSVPEQYLRADQLVVSGDDKATNKNWNRVRSVRIGLVLRSRPGAAAPSDTGPKDLNTLYPLGGLFQSKADSGSVFSPKGDGRFRQVVTFTVHIRNSAS